MRPQLIAALTVGAAAVAVGIVLAVQSDTALFAVSEDADGQSAPVSYEPLEPAAPEPVDTEVSYDDQDTYVEDSYYEDDYYSDPLEIDEATLRTLEAQAEARAAVIRASGNGTFAVPSDGIFDCISPWYWTSDWTDSDIEDYAQCLAAM